MSAITLPCQSSTDMFSWLRPAAEFIFSSTVPPMIDAAPKANPPTVSIASDDTRTDEALLVAYREGDRDAFATLLERYRNDLMHFLVRFLGSRAAAEDVFQEAFLQVHISADRFDADRRFKPWLFTIAANKGRDFHRRRRRRDAVSLSTPIGKSEGRDAQMVDILEGEHVDADANLLDEERQALVKQVVDGMPAHYREILLLSYFQRLSYNQIADSLSIPLGTVKSRLHASVANFADAWKAARGLSNPTDGPDLEAVP